MTRQRPRKKLHVPGRAATARRPWRSVQALLPPSAGHRAGLSKRSWPPRMKTRWSVASGRLAHLGSAYAASMSRKSPSESQTLGKEKRRPSVCEERQRDGLCLASARTEQSELARELQGGSRARQEATRPPQLHPPARSLLNTTARRAPAAPLQG